MAKRGAIRPSWKQDWWNIGMIVALVAALLFAGYAGIVAMTREESDYVSTYTPPVAEAPVVRTAADRDADLDTIRALVASPEPVTISVLGDSTGNSANEWVALWARDLAQTKTVRIHYWEDETYKPDVEQIGSGPVVDIWNGSQPGAGAGYAVDHLDELQPEPPAVTLVNFGHNQQAASAGSEIGRLIAATGRKWATDIPTAVVLQNVAGEPRAQRSADNVESIKRMAESRAIPTLDVHAEFAAAPDLNSLIAADGTGVHPTPAGSEIWARVVSDQLNP
ncbi:SGNH/GDSL hydrolase family protein [Rhodococcus fascians]|nr:SGNH/GDSL hydrolase family protein [Rhodococcus fascians]MBY4237790.1 SGNH/GDSL hydrolase family protein [Rhodococcus fascians]MBY4253993.1 SGNH/GDSL hydrolase family protein [Rhodococcus fascians]MBY4269136.1 SGNH/GDSL hydrolase family protein [Rhodococcus fascians]